MTAGKMLDINELEHLQITIGTEGQVWVNDIERCLLRVKRVTSVILQDNRFKTSQAANETRLDVKTAVDRLGKVFTGTYWFARAEVAMSNLEQDGFDAAPYIIIWCNVMPESMPIMGKYHGYGIAFMVTVPPSSTSSQRKTSVLPDGLLADGRYVTRHSIYGFAVVQVFTAATGVQFYRYELPAATCGMLSQKWIDVAEPSRIVDAVTADTEVDNTAEALASVGKTTEIVSKARLDRLQDIEQVMEACPVSDIKQAIEYASSMNRDDRPNYDIRDSIRGWLTRFYLLRGDVDG